MRNQFYILSAPLKFLIKVVRSVYSGICGTGEDMSSAAATKTSTPQEYIGAATREQKNLKSGTEDRDSQSLLAEGETAEDQVKRIFGVSLNSEIDLKNYPLRPKQ